MKIQLNITLPTVLLIIFVILKLMHVITWSWLWVLSPIWIYGIFVILCVIAVIIYHYYQMKRWDE